MGGPGSNQAIANSTYLRYVSDDLEPGCIYFSPEGTNMENGLNLLGTMSPEYMKVDRVHVSWTSPISIIKTALKLIFNPGKDDFVSAPGGEMFVSYF
jgi:hypothetical protein